MTGRRFALAAAAAAALALAGGAVYLKLDGPAGRLRAAGGRELFREDAVVNGVAGTLRVFSLPSGPAGAEPASGPLGSGAWCVRVPGARPGAPAAALLFEAPGAGRPAPGARPWPVRGVPPPDGLEPSFAATLAGGATAAAAGVCGDSPDSAAARLRVALLAGGWAEATPGADAARSFFFRRGGAVAFGCAVARADGATGWLLLRSDRALP